MLEIKLSWLINPNPLASLLSSDSIYFEIDKFINYRYDLVYEYFHKLKAIDWKFDYWGGNLSWSPERPLLSIKQIFMNVNPF